MADTVELALIPRNTETASRDARAAIDSTEQWVVGVGPGMAALEARLSGLGVRIGGMEQGLDGIARSNDKIATADKIETALADIIARLPG